MFNYKNNKQFVLHAPRIIKALCYKQIEITEQPTKQTAAAESHLLLKMLWKWKQI